VQNAIADDILHIKSIGPYQVLVLGLGALVLFADGFDAQMVGNVAPAIAGDWHVKTPAFAPVFAANVFGLMIGAMAVTPLADALGRRWVIAVCALVFGLASLFTATLSDIQTFAVVRFVAGLALGGAMPAMIAASSDYVPMAYRGRLAVLLTTAWPFGITICGLTTGALVETAGWRSLFLIGGVLPLLLVPAILALQPESPAFLLRKGRGERLKAILHRIDPSLPLPRQPEAKAGPRIPVLSLFADGLAPTSLLLWLAYFSAGVTVYFFLNWLGLLVKDAGYTPSQSAYAATLYQLGGLIGALAVSVLVDRWGALVPAVMLVGASVVVAAVGLLTGSFATLAGIVVLAGVMVTGSQGAANGYVGGVLYPSEVRATGLGWALGILRLSGVLCGSLLAGALLSLKLGPAATLRIIGMPELVAAAAFLGVALLRSRASRRADSSYLPMT
jgi:AAHS family 4-hydroxybenzoate transporter-like MFS transporter